MQLDIAFLYGPDRWLGRGLPMEISQRQLRIERGQDVRKMSESCRGRGVGHVDGVIVGHLGGRCGRGCFVRYEVSLDRH